MSDFLLICLFGAILLLIFGAMNFVAAKQYYDEKPKAPPENPSNK